MPNRDVVQPVLGCRSSQVLTVDGLRFRDLNHNGRLDPYEDWRLAPEIRTADLVHRLGLEDLAGLLVHGSLQDASFYRSPGALNAVGGGAVYDLDRARGWILSRRMSSFVTRLNGSATEMATANNRIQEIAESSPFGIPVTISADPKRHHLHLMLDASKRDRAFSLWPEPLGLAAIDDPELTRRLGDTVRREYLSVGIRESLAPQADLATEPRWTRVAGTFGEDAAIAERMVQAYVTGVQGGPDGVNKNSVVAVVKHWAGYGAAKDGWDSHNFYGRFSIFEPGRFAYHLQPYNGAFKAHVGGVMPSYSVLEGVTLEGKPVEPVGLGFSKQLLGNLRRERYHFEGVVLSDWRITYDCMEVCRAGSVPGVKPLLKDTGMPWGVEELSKPERFAKAINAGVEVVAHPLGQRACVCFFLWQTLLLVQSLAAYASACSVFSTARSRT